MIVVYIWQGLGNQMFQYAFAKGIEMHLKGKVYYSTKNVIAPLKDKEMGSNTKREFGLCNFNISLKEIPEWKLALWKYVNLDKWYHYFFLLLFKHGLYPYSYYSQQGKADISVMSPTYDEIKMGTYFRGWFQSCHYFEDIRDVLIRDFTPRETLRLNEKLERLLKKNTVSVHIRRGDYIKDRHELSNEYYQKAIAHMEERIENPTYLVFSDDSSWAKDHLKIVSETVFVDEEIELEDYHQLYLMSLCKHNIIANSSFSWWGAWLNQNQDKIVIAPNKWYSSQQNIVPKEWIIIN